MLPHLGRFYDSGHVDTYAPFRKAHEKAASSFRRVLLVRATLRGLPRTIRRCIFAIAAAAFGFTTSPHVVIPAGRYDRTRMNDATRCTFDAAG